MDYEELNQAYEGLIQPDKLINHFKTDEEFVQWLFYGDLLDLYATLKAFEDMEMYEHCAIIRDVIRYKES